LKTILLSIAASQLVGCAQRGPLLSGRFTTYGTLKSSLSHLEYENQQLRTQVTKLESENRDIENRLVLEEEDNGDLTTRLNDARNLLTDRGYDLGGSLGRASSSDDAPSRTVPAAQSNRQPRKPPFARIPGRIDAAPSTDDTSNKSTLPSNDAFGSQSWQDD